MNALLFCATAAATPAYGGWWKLIGAFLIVFGLLVVFLKVLGRMQRGGGSADVSLLRVQSLGPRRSLEFLRCGDRVFKLYRSEQSMVLLDQEPFDPALHAQAPAKPSLPDWLDRLRGGGRG
jgi:flagellar biogenesis protein FliO